MLYSKKEFDIFTDLEECADFIDWESLSYSKDFDKHRPLTRNPASERYPGIRMSSN